jgi:hypothetical protein
VPEQPIDPEDVAAIDQDLLDLDAVVAGLKGADASLVNLARAGKVGRAVLEAALVGLATAASSAAGGPAGGLLGGAVAKGVAKLAPLAAEKLADAIEKALARDAS